MSIVRVAFTKTLAILLAIILLSTLSVVTDIEAIYGESAKIHCLTGVRAITAVDNPYSMRVFGKYLVIEDVNSRFGLYDTSKGSMKWVSAIPGFVFIGLADHYLYGLIGNDIYRRDFLTDEYTRVVKDVGWEIAYSTVLEGQKIVWRDTRRVTHGAGGDSGSESIYLLDLATGKESAVFSAPGGLAGIRLHQDKLYFYQYKPDNSEPDKKAGFFEKDLKSGKTRELAVIPNDFLKYIEDKNLKVAADGNLVVYAAGEVSELPVYYVQDLSTGETRVLDFEPFAVSNGMVFGWRGPKYGKQEEQPRQLYLYDFAGKTQTRLMSWSGSVDFDRPPVVTGKSLFWLETDKNKVCRLMTAVVTEEAFSDTANHWARPYIEMALGNGWANGYAGRLFKPDASVTRAEFITMLVSALDLTPVEYEKPTFADTAGHWAEKAGYLESAVWAGLVVPADYNGGVFDPDSYLNRQEAAMMLTRGMNKASKAEADTEWNLPFMDSPDIPDSAAGYVYQVYDYKVMGGYPDGTFGGGRQVTRAEAVAMIQKMLVVNENEKPEPINIIYGDRRLTLKINLIERYKDIFIPARILAMLGADVVVRADKNEISISKGATVIRGKVDNKPGASGFKNPASFRDSLGEVMVPSRLLRGLWTIGWEKNKRILYVDDVRIEEIKKDDKAGTNTKAD